MCLSVQMHSLAGLRKRKSHWQIDKTAALMGMQTPIGVGNTHISAGVGRDNATGNSTNHPWNPLGNNRFHRNPLPILEINPFPKPKSSCIVSDDLAVLRNNANHRREATPQFVVCNQHPESIQPNEPSGAHFISGASASKKGLRISGAESSPPSATSVSHSRSLTAQRWEGFNRYGGRSSHAGAPKAHPNRSNSIWVA